MTEQEGIKFKSMTRIEESQQKTEDRIIMTILTALSYTVSHDSFIEESHPANLTVAVPPINRQQYPQLGTLMCFRIFQDAPSHRFDLHGSDKIKRREKEKMK